jgi:hypothetical protein
MKFDSTVDNCCWQLLESLKEQPLPEEDEANLNLRF